MSNSCEGADCLAADAKSVVVAAEAVRNAEGVIYDVSLVTAITNGKPVVLQSVSDDTTTLAVDALRPDMAEFPPKFIGRSNVADTLEGAQTEAGNHTRAEAAST